MKENLIIRKRHLLVAVMLSAMMCLGGCAPQVTTQTYTHEAGEELPADAAAYAEFKNQEQAEAATVDASKVDADNVGSYDAAIVLNGKEYPFLVEVVDTTAPDGTFASFTITAGIETKITADSFGIESTDVSDVKHGFRNTKLVKTEEEVKEILSEEVKTFDKYDEINVEEALKLSWNQETDAWYETDVTWESISENFVPEENGLYRLELVSVDSFGNADVMYCYVLADLEAPVVTVASDLEVSSTYNMDMNDFMNLLCEEMAAEDNMLGDISAMIHVNSATFGQINNGMDEVTVSFAVSDCAGNETISEQMIKDNVKGLPGESQQQVATANVHDRARAEQAFAQVNQQRAAAGLHELVWDESMYEFACTRATQIVNDFSHNLPDGTGVSEHLLYNVGGANGYGENIARNYKSINNLINGWMNSLGHKENILDSRYTAGVMACYYCNGTYYWVNLFKAQ